MMVTRRAGILFLFSMFLLTYRAAAQHAGDTTEKLDTTVADTIVVGAGASGPVSKLDTSTLVGNGDQTDSDIPDTMSLRTVPDSIVNAFKKDRRYAYANDPAYWTRQREENGGPAEWLLKVFLSPGFRYFIYIALGGLLLFVIVRIMSENNFGLFYRRRGRRSKGEEGQDEVPVEEDLDERLQHYLALKDHRHAVRYLYLRSLRGLNEKGLIRQTLQSTNHEYLRQLSGTPQERPFRFLTTAYEKIWYGEFTLGEGQFQRLYQHFVDFDKTVQP